MLVFPVFCAAALAGAMLGSAEGLGGFRPLTIDPVTAEPVGSGAPAAFLMMIQLVFGFSATAAVASADWGSVVRAPATSGSAGWSAWRWRRRSWRRWPC